MTRFVTTASVPAGQGERYVRQLAKHWAHSLSVDEAEDATRVVFPRDARGADWPGDAIVVRRYARAMIAWMVVLQF